MSNYQAMLPITPNNFHLKHHNIRGGDLTATSTTTTPPSTTTTPRPRHLDPVLGLDVHHRRALVHVRALVQHAGIGGARHLQDGRNVAVQPRVPLVDFFRCLHCAAPVSTRSMDSVMKKQQGNVAKKK